MKFIEAVPLPDKSAVTSSLFKVQVAIYITRTLTSCNIYFGKEFKNQFVRELSKHLGIGRFFSKPYHPHVILFSYDSI